MGNPPHRPGLTHSRRGRENRLPRGDALPASSHGRYTHRTRIDAAARPDGGPARAPGRPAPAAHRGAGGRQHDVEHARVPPAAGALPTGPGDRDAPGGGREADRRVRHGVPRLLSAGVHVRGGARGGDQGPHRDAHDGDRQAGRRSGLGQQAVDRPVRPLQPAGGRRGHPRSQAADHAGSERPEPVRRREAGTRRGVLLEAHQADRGAPGEARRDRRSGLARPAHADPQPRHLRHRDPPLAREGRAAGSALRPRAARHRQLQARERHLRPPGR